MDSWLTAARDAVAKASDTDRAALDLTDEEATALLELARIAAHDSGKRTNAPLLCYLAGRATAGGASLDSLVDAVRRSS